ncbi:MAG: class B sortase [Clostridia bacterium]|nr:class B sortase [Clostridia bacterium]
MDNQKKKKISLVIMIVFGAVFLVCAIILLIKGFPDKSYKNSKNTNSISSTTSGELPENPIKFDELKAQNSDVVGYITIDGTVVDNPVLRPGDETEEGFYLEHDWLKNPKFAGSIYMQKMSSEDFSDNCTVLYGHNTRAGSEMFSELRKYRDADFFGANRKITICIPGHVLKYEIFSAFTYDSRHILYSFDFNKEEDFNSFVNDCVNPKTIYTAFVEQSAVPKWGDKLLVLSTCTDNYSEDLRYIVVSKLVEDIKTK